MTARLIAIEDPTDERLDGYRKIRERDLRRRDGLFVAEGTVVLDALLRSSTFEAASLLILRNRLSGIAAYLETVPDETPAYIVDRPVIDAVAGFPMHRGLLALARQRSHPSLKDVITNAGNRILVLCGLANHDNVGACFRVASAFGVGAVLLDETCADPLYRKSIRVSTGAVLRVPFVHGGGIDGILDAVANAGVDTLALTPSAEPAIEDADANRALALVLGTEGEGLPAPVLSRLETAKIPMAVGHDSLNVATSAAVALYALRLGGEH